MCGLRSPIYLRMTLTKPKHQMMGVRQFREIFPTLTQPTSVYRLTGKIEKLGEWTPEKPDEPTRTKH